MNDHYDLYICVDLTAPSMSSLIARSSDDGADYASCMVGLLAAQPDLTRNSPTWEAYRRAIEAQLALSPEALEQNYAKLHLTQDMLYASRIVEAAQTVACTFTMSARQIGIAKNHIKTFLSRASAEEHEKEYYDAVVKFLGHAEKETAEYENSQKPQGHSKGVPVVADGASDD